jgi:hypothetical protein
MFWQTSSRILIATATEENHEERRFGAATPDRILGYPGHEYLRAIHVFVRVVEPEVRGKIFCKVLSAYYTG